MGIQREIVKVSELSTGDRDRMFNLMCQYYTNTIPELFDHDLEEKDWVLMLREEESKQIVGFSTQMLFPFAHHGKEMHILFSGDTIIQKEHWGSMALSLLFGELMIKLLKEYEGKELYWMLISKGLRTYKYLPAFYIDYYPCDGKEIPPGIQELMHALGQFKFPGSYIPEKGIVKAKSKAQYLKEDFHAMAKPTKKHELFFYECNPGYAKGDELLCLTRLSMDNINPFIKRLISKYL